MDLLSASIKVAVAGAVFAALFSAPIDVHGAPAFVCTTQTHRIEIEAVGGGDKYDYRSWRLNKPGDGPALTLRGSMQLQGTGVCGTRYWTFKNGKYEYLVADNPNCGEQAPPAGAIGQLTVSLSGKEISESWCLVDGGSRAVKLLPAQAEAPKPQRPAPSLVAEGSASKTAQFEPGLQLKPTASPVPIADAGQSGGSLARASQISASSGTTPTALPVRSSSNNSPPTHASAPTAQKGGFWNGVVGLFKASPEAAAETACEKKFHSQYLKPGYVDTKIDVDFYRYADNSRRKIYFDDASENSGFIHMKAGKFLEHATKPIGETEAKWQRSLDWSYESKGGGWNYWKCSLTRTKNGTYEVESIRVVSVDEIDRYDSARSKN